MECTQSHQTPGPSKLSQVSFQESKKKELQRTIANLKAVFPQHRDMRSAGSFVKVGASNHKGIHTVIVSIFR